MAQLKVQQKKSAIGRQANQRETLRSLGLKRIGDVVEQRHEAIKDRNSLIGGDGIGDIAKERDDSGNTEDGSERQIYSAFADPRHIDYEGSNQGGRDTEQRRARTANKDEIQADTENNEGQELLGTADTGVDHDRQDNGGARTNHAAPGEVD